MRLWIQGWPAAVKRSDASDSSALFLDISKGALLRRNTIHNWTDRMRLNGKFRARIVCCWFVLCCAVSFVAAGHAQTIDEAYKQALKEGGVLNVYGTLTPDTAGKVLPVF